MSDKTQQNQAKSSEKAQQIANWTRDRSTGEPRVSRRGDGRIGGHAQRGGGNGWRAYSNAFGMPALHRMRALDVALIQGLAALQAGLDVDLYNNTPRGGCVRLRVTVPSKPKRTRAKCGARTRSGAACKATVCLKRDGSAAKRCKLHGGKSTGPTSQAGRDAIAESNRRRKAAREAATIAHIDRAAA